MVDKGDGNDDYECVASRGVGPTTRAGTQDILCGTLAQVVMSIIRVKIIYFMLVCGCKKGGFFVFSI